MRTDTRRTESRSCSADRMNGTATPRVRRFRGAVAARWRLATLTLALLGQPREAMAHHPLAVEVPGSILGGLLSGLAHPVIGPDHLAIIVAMGVIAAVAAARFLPVVFLVASLAGCLAHLAGVVVGGVEVAVAVSVMSAGLFLALGTKSTPTVLAVGYALAGTVHGYAYGESMVGVEPTPLVGYLLGLAMIQFVVAIGAFTVTRRLDERGFPGALVLRRAVGVAVILIGAVGVVSVW